MYAHDEQSGDFKLFHEHSKYGCHQEGTDYFCFKDNVVFTNQSAGISCPSALYSRNAELVKENCEMNIVRLQMPVIYQMTKSEYVILSEEQHTATLVCYNPDPVTGHAVPTVSIKYFERYNRYTHKPNCQLKSPYFKLDRMSNIEEEALEQNLTLPFNRASLLDIFPEDLVNKTLDKMLVQGTPEFSTWMAQVHHDIENGLNLNSSQIHFTWGTAAIAILVIVVLGIVYKKCCNRANGANGGASGGHATTNLILRP